MRSCGALSLSIWLYSSLYLFIIGIVCTFVTENHTYMIPIWGLFIFFPLLILHIGFIYFLRKLGYKKDDIKWISSLVGWFVYTIFMIQNTSNLIPHMWLIIFVLGGCSSLAVLTTFRKKDDFSIEEPPLSLNSS
jgi:hypothetical protein